MHKLNSEGTPDCHSSEIWIRSCALTLNELQLKFDFRNSSLQHQGSLGVRLSAWYQKHPLASLVVMQQPSCTAAICCLQQAPRHTTLLSPALQTAATAELLKAAKRFAIDRQLLMIQYVVSPDDCSDVKFDIPKILQQSGFEHSTNIEQLGLSTPMKSSSEKTDAVQALPLFHYRSRSDLLVQPWVNSLLRLLQAILNSSQDLKTVPRPSAEDLLLSWAAMQGHVTILIAKQPVDYSGLVVFSCDPNEAEGHRLTLEYAGTDPALRRQRVAYELLDAAITASDHEMRSARATLTAFVDGHNIAACNLYARYGMTSVRTHEMWTLDVGTNSTRLGAPTSSHTASQDSGRA